MHCAKKMDEKRKVNVLPVGERVGKLLAIFGSGRFIAFAAQVGLFAVGVFINHPKACAAIFGFFQLFF